jgi:hypothetical protein
MKKIALTVMAGLLATIAGCTDADIASSNLSQAADNFELQRRIIFINGITDKYLMSIEGLCSLGNQDAVDRLSVTCKVGPGAFKKHFLGLSDNVTFISEQLESADVSTYHYRVIFKPQTILPDIDFKGDAGELVRNRN